MGLVLLAGITSFLAPLTLAQEVQPHYTVVDRGPSLVRTLTDTPGLNNHGDMAIWHAETASLMPGVVFHGKDTISIEGEKDFPLVYPADINDRLDGCRNSSGGTRSALHARFQVV